MCLFFRLRPHNSQTWILFSRMCLSWLFHMSQRIEMLSSSGRLYISKDVLFNEQKFTFFPHLHLAIRYLELFLVFMHLFHLSWTYTRLLSFPLKCHKLLHLSLVLHLLILLHPLLLIRFMNQTPIKVIFVLITFR